MPFIEQKEEVINDEGVPFIKPQVEVTLKHKVTGKEYSSDAEALADLQDPNSETKPGDITRSVKINVKLPPFGAKTNL
jgi:hypothetical protein|tara:strand:- start:632 stop:865 length:234 start_codon:yes stop_codon:yes gene_type:complete